MQSKYIGLSCPDNPARVADYGVMPWENDIEPETVSEKAATGGALFALSKGEGALGHGLGDLIDILLNLDHTELADVVLAMYPDQYPDEAKRARDRFEATCGELANEFLETT